eukprot:NODE_390_length_8164_cov_0.195908.p4 type:complete len:172 gc:universal NODE_390_length_8164_cov_0.195908:8119-7604(-)
MEIRTLGREGMHSNLFCHNWNRYDFVQEYYTYPLHKDKLDSSTLNLQKHFSEEFGKLEQDDKDLIIKYSTTEWEIFSFSAWINVGEGNIENYPLAFVPNSKSKSEAYYYENMKKGNAFVFNDSTTHGTLGRRIVNLSNTERHSISLVCLSLPPDLRAVVTKIENMILKSQN